MLNFMSLVQAQIAKEFQNREQAVLLSSGFGLYFSATKYFPVFYNLVSLVTRVFLEAQMVKNLPAMQETQVQFLGREDPLEKEMATHSSILAWRIPWAEEPDSLQSMGSPESDMT